MQFLLFDVGATVVFLSGYLTVVALQRRREPHLAPSPGSEGPTTREAHREWPRLSYPR